MTFGKGRKAPSKCAKRTMDDREKKWRTKKVRNRRYERRFKSRWYGEVWVGG